MNSQSLFSLQGEGYLMNADEYSVPRPVLPRIDVPATSRVEHVLPKYDGLTTDAQADHDLRLITQVQHVATEIYPEWKYESRRKAQVILPFLYLGPSAAARDIEALRRDRITMLLVIRNTRSAQAHLFSGNKAAAQLNIASAAVDVDGPQELIAAFPRAIGIINKHLLAVYRNQNLESDTPINREAFAQAGYSTGKVLIFCETGNERSAAVAIAYLLNMYHMGLVEAIQFVQAQRFSVVIDDGCKHLLQTYADIVFAQRTVKHDARVSGHLPNLNYAFDPRNLAPGPLAKRPFVKRTFNDLSDEEDEVDGQKVEYDAPRFQGGRTFAPFVSMTDIDMEALCIRNDQRGP